MYFLWDIRYEFLMEWKKKINILKREKRISLKYETKFYEWFKKIFM